MSAVVRPDEAIDRLTSLGLDIFVHQDKPVFRLPCHNLTPDGCAVYAHRPFTCSHFRCELLKDYEAGKVSFAEAKMIIKQVKTLLTQHDLRAKLEAIAPVRGLDYRKLLQAVHAAIAEADDPAALRKTHGQILIVAMQVVHLLQSHFYRPSE